MLDSGHATAIKSLTFCPAPGWLVSGGDDGTVSVWDLLHADQKPLVLHGNAGRIVQVLVTPQWLVVGYYNGAILLWDIRRCILVSVPRTKRVSSCTIRRIGPVRSALDPCLLRSCSSRSGTDDGFGGRFIDSREVFEPVLPGIVVPAQVVANELCLAAFRPVSEDLDQVAAGLGLIDQ